MKLCKDCKHWERANPDHYKTHRDREKILAGGWCGNDSKIQEDYGEYPLDGLSYSYLEGGSFWTGPNFGCVHWEAK